MNPCIENMTEFETMDTTTDDQRLAGPGRWKNLPLFWFILFLSYQCTRRCRFCYAFNQVGSNNRQEMDDTVFSRLLDWIPMVWEKNRIQVNIINFLGGEPLLRTDRIRQLLDTVAPRTGKMQNQVNTNGDLVDSVNWDDLEQVRWMTVNITDIGIDELARRMAVIRDRSNVINQTIAVTLDEHNIGRIIDISRFGLENGYRLRYNKDLFMGKDPAYQEQLLHAYHELCDLLENYAARGFDIHSTFLLDTLIPGWDHPSSPYPCGKRLAVVFPDGSIGPCIRDHDFKTGTLFDDDPLDRLDCSTFHFDLAQPDIPEDCRTCEVKLACQGGCPHDKRMVTGDRKGRSVTCRIHREILPRLKALEQ